MPLQTDVYVMNPNSNITLEIGTAINVKFNIYNAGNERGQFHTALYIDGSLKDSKSGHLDSMTYSSDMECWYRLYMPPSGTRRIKFVGGYATGGRWVDDYIREFIVSPPAQKGRFKIQVREAGTTNYVDGASVCLKASGSSIGCKKTSNGVTDWFSNIGLDKNITGTITKAGFVTYNILGFHVSQVNNQMVTYQLSKKEQLGSIKVSSSPSGAKAYVGGYYKGLTPLTVSDLPDYTHNIYVTLTGCETPAIKYIKVIAGQTVDVSFTLESTGDETVETELLWDGDQPTTAGIDQSVDFKFKLELVTGDVLNAAEVGLVVDGQAVGAKVSTSNYGNVRLSRAFKTAGDHRVYAVFATTYDYKGSTSAEKTVKVTAPTSAYRITAEGIPEGKKYHVKSYEGTGDRYWDPAKKYEVTSVNNRCDILRSELASPNVTRTMRLFDEAGGLIYTSEEVRALKSTNDILEVRLDANQGLNFRINMSHLPNAPAVGEAFNVNATVIKGQKTPVGANQPVAFKEEIAEGQYETEGQVRHTNDFGIATCQYLDREEGTYKFIAVYKYEDATCDPHTVTVGGKESDLVSFLEPVFAWVGEVFNVDEETAKTYTYVGVGIAGLAFLGKMLGGGGGK